MRLRRKVKTKGRKFSRKYYLEGIDFVTVDKTSLILYRKKKKEK